MAERPARIQMAIHLKNTTRMSDVEILQHMGGVHLLGEDLGILVSVLAAIPRPQPAPSLHPFYQYQATDSHRDMGLSRTFYNPTFERSFGQMALPPASVQPFPRPHLAQVQTVLPPTISTVGRSEVHEIVGGSNIVVSKSTAKLDHMAGEKLTERVRKSLQGLTKMRPDNSDFVINTCRDYIVDSNTLKTKPDAIKENLEKNIGGNPKLKNTANDVRKYLTFFLRGFVPVLLEDKEELLTLVSVGGKVGATGTGATGAKKKKRRLAEVTDEAGEAKGAAGAGGGAAMVSAEKADVEEPVALREKLEELEATVQARDKTVEEYVASKEKLEGDVQARDKTIEEYVALKEKLEDDLQDRDKKFKKLNKEVATKAAGGETAKLQSRIKKLERYKQVHEKEVERLREQLTAEKTRHIVTGLDAGCNKRSQVRVLDFAIRAATLATVTESINEERLLYRPDYTLLTYAVEIGLLNTTVNLDVLNDWTSWGWDVERIQKLCREGSVVEGKVDAKSVLSSMIQRTLKGDHPLLSDEEAESMNHQLQDLADMQGCSDLQSFVYEKFREWVKRVLAEYKLWNGERNFKRRPSQEPSSAALQKEVLEWYKICKEEYAKSVSLSHREFGETVRKQAKYSVPMAAYAYSRARPAVINDVE